MLESRRKGVTQLEERGRGYCVGLRFRRRLSRSVSLNLSVCLSVSHRRCSPFTWMIAATLITLISLMTSA